MSSLVLSSSSPRYFPLSDSSMLAEFTPPSSSLPRFITPPLTLCMSLISFSVCSFLIACSFAAWVCFALARNFCMYWSAFSRFCYSMNILSSSFFCCSQYDYLAIMARLRDSMWVCSFTSSSLFFIFCSIFYARSSSIYLNNLAWCYWRFYSTYSEVTSPTSSEVQGSFTYYPGPASYTFFLCTGESPDGKPANFSFFLISYDSPSMTGRPANYLNFCLYVSIILYLYLCGSPLILSKKLLSS